jgi:hypothetical protein
MRRLACWLLDTGPVLVLAAIAGAGSFTHIRDTARDRHDSSPCPSTSAQHGSGSSWRRLAGHRTRLHHRKWPAYRAVQLPAQLRERLRQGRGPQSPRPRDSQDLRILARRPRRPPSRRDADPSPLTDRGDHEHLQRSVLGGDTQGTQAPRGSSRPLGPKIVAEAIPIGVAFAHIEPLTAANLNPPVAQRS